MNEYPIPIEFKHTIHTDATGDSPSELLAKKGEKGKILRAGGFGYEFYVQPENGDPFYCNKNEIIILKS